MLRPIFKSEAEKAEFSRLRSYYAGCALTALSKKIGDYGFNSTPPSQVQFAELAFSYADNMLQVSRQFEYEETDE